jgi:glycoside/pentoside/hexuronide:cation symporter, GPH family
MRGAGDSERGLSVREYLSYSLGDTASCFYFWTFNIFLTYYYVDVWGLGAAAVSLMMLVVRLVDALANPVMGLVADRTLTRWGRFRPYLVWLALPYGVCGYLMFANPGFESTGRLVYAYVTYTLMVLAYTAINVPYNALLGVLSPSPKVRTLAASYRFAGANAGGLLVSLLVRPLVKALGGGQELSGFQHTMALFAAASVLLFLLSFAGTRERVAPPVGQQFNARAELGELLRNGPWLVLLVAAVFSTTFIAMRSASTLFYFKYCQGDDGRPLLWVLDRSTLFLASGMASQVLGNVALAVVAKKADKRRLATALTAVTAVCFASFYVLPKDNFGLQLAVNALGTFCMGPTSALSFALYGDAADYGEWKFGRRSTALVYSASLFALKVGSMIAGFLVPVFLGAFGFVRDQVQSPSALLGLTLAFSLVPGLFAALKALALWRFPLDSAALERIEGELAQRRLVAATG